jgi:hypothetical protein
VILSAVLTSKLIRILQNISEIDVLLNKHWDRAFPQLPGFGKSYLPVSHFALKNQQNPDCQ